MSIQFPVDPSSCLSTQSELELARCGCLQESKNNLAPYITLAKGSRTTSSSIGCSSLSAHPFFFSTSMHFTQVPIIRWILARSFRYKNFYALSYFIGTKLAAPILGTLLILLSLSCRCALPHLDLASEPFRFESSKRSNVPTEALALG